MLKYNTFALQPFIDSLILEHSFVPFSTISMKACRALTSEDRKLRHKEKTERDS